MSKPSASTVLRCGLLPSLAVLLGACEGDGLMDRLQNIGSYGLCSAIVVVIDLVFIVEVLRSDRSLLGKVLWGLVIVLAPCLGCVLYFLFARRARAAPTKEPEGRG